MRRTARSGSPPRSTATTRTGSSSSPTATRAYLSGDLAYYLDKRERGFDRCFIMLGADHHGYVGRMMAMCAAFGDVPQVNLEILIGQMVNLLRDGEPLRMSKRAGTVVTIDDLVERDRRRRCPLRAGPLHSDSPIDIDLDLWARPTSDNPVFYVQYAHARSPACCATPPTSACRRTRALRPRAARPTRRRVSCCARSPSSRGSSRPRPSCASRTGWRATSRTPPATYHRFYDNCRVLPMGDEEPADLHRARLMLVEATRVVLANGLGLLGVSAPERM